jgi:hypothetical protein
MDTIHRTTKEKHRMSEMIERVAKVIYDKFYSDNWPPTHESNRQDSPNFGMGAENFRLAARAAIAEFREQLLNIGYPHEAPCVAMIETALEKPNFVPCDGCDGYECITECQYPWEGRDSVPITVPPETAS